MHIVFIIRTPLPLGVSKIQHFFLQNFGFSVNFQVQPRKHNTKHHWVVHISITQNYLPFRKTKQSIIWQLILYVSTKELPDHTYQIFHKIAPPRGQRERESAHEWAQPLVYVRVAYPADKNQYKSVLVIIKHSFWLFSVKFSFLVNIVFKWYQISQNRDNSKHITEFCRVRRGGTCLCALRRWWSGDALPSSWFSWL